MGKVYRAHSSRCAAKCLGLFTAQKRLQSGRQTLTALGTATGQNAQATLGLHTLAKTMSALSYKLTWLIGSFHGSGSKFYYRVTSAPRERSTRNRQRPAPTDDVRCEVGVYTQDDVISQRNTGLVEHATIVASSRLRSNSLPE